jgi:GTP-binding protein
MGRNRTGAGADDQVIRVPVGTQILADDDDRSLIADMTRPGQRVVLLRGGDGGKGNSHYKTSTNRAPRQFQPGFPGGELWVWLRLKLLADAGLLGAPNAGKSTFLNAVSNAAAKVGDYPFTTLKPQLGVVAHKGKELVMADIPGLIAGAADGIGIGDRFLGHIERCRVLLHLVDASAASPVKAWRTVRDELEAYGGGLIDKPEVLALTKSDLVTPASLAAKKRALAKASGQEVHVISAATRQGVDGVLDALIMLAGRDLGAVKSEGRAWTPL